MSSANSSTIEIEFGDVLIRPRVEDGYLVSLGVISVAGSILRGDEIRFAPWFDAYEGGLFNRFRYEGVDVEEGGAVIRLTALMDYDYPFRERRDSSGDLCFTPHSWDRPAEEAELRIHFEAAADAIDDRSFSGFKYWFEYDCDAVAIHRLIDRQTWELGGNLDDVTVVCRNWLTPPAMKIGKETTYSTVGLDDWKGPMPGNLWGRWTQMPSFDMQYGERGVLVAWFDEVSNIRTVIESQTGEDVLRIQDVHHFEQANTVRTNAKTVLYSPDLLDSIDALNLWTEITDREQTRACAQFDIPEESPPALWIGDNQWVAYQFETSYEHSLATASELGMDYLFIDVIWEQRQAYRQDINRLIPEEKQKGTTIEKFRHESMCAVLDFEVANAHGGEAGLKRLCDEATEKGVKIMSWLALHASPDSNLGERQPELGVQKEGFGSLGIFAAKESGSHPDTGYAASCWPLNQNMPIREYVRDKILGICERTGLAGFLWDSFSNLGWWQVDYSAGTMRPQFDKHAQLYAELVKAGLYLAPEAIVTFSNHSMLHLFRGDVYDGDLLGYSYNTNIAFHCGGDLSGGSNPETFMLRGEMDTEPLYRLLSHKRAPSMALHKVPREEWDEASAEKLKELFAAYRSVRDRMKKRTVLKADAGVIWEDGSNEAVLFNYHPGESSVPLFNVTTGASETTLAVCSVYSGPAEAIQAIFEKPSNEPVVAEV